VKKQGFAMFFVLNNTGMGLSKKSKSFNRKERKEYTQRAQRTYAKFAKS
jgi:hypothetical protein